MPPAQFYNWYDVNLRMKLLGIETKKVARMTEEAAVSLGAEILGEVIILTVAIIGLILEFGRRSKNDSDKGIRQQERLSNIEKEVFKFETMLTDRSSHILKLKQMVQN